MTALTLYGSSVASVTLATAAQLSIATGGTETSIVTTGPATGNGFIEILGLTGTTAAVSAAIPSPTGLGFLWDAPTLESKTIQAGNWSGLVGLSDAAGTGPILGVTLRFFKRSSGGVYTLIGSSASGNDTITTTRTTYTIPTVALSSMAFATGDRLYIDCWLDANGWGSDPIHDFVSNSSSQGVASDLQVTTPGFLATGTHLLCECCYGGVYS